MNPPAAAKANAQPCVEPKRAQDNWVWQQTINNEEEDSYERHSEM